MLWGMRRCVRLRGIMHFIDPDTTHSRMVITAMRWLVLSLVMLGPVAAARSAEFSTYDGQYIRLHLDVGDDIEARQYVDAFDAGIAQVAAYWDLPTSELAAWRVEATLMTSRQAATAAGLMQDRIPDFKFGYAAGRTLYVIAQPSVYYNEHLLLHEGIHALVQHVFGGRGPTWFMEGTAELWATHRGRGADVQINEIPHSREESPYWGRLKIIRDAREAGSIPSIESIMRAPPRLDGDVNAYTWSWVLCMLLTEYPPYNDVFQAMTIAGHDESNALTRQLYQRLRPDWPALVARFRLLAHALDYGFDWHSERVAIRSNDPRWDRAPINIRVAADQGWQSVGVVIPAGRTITVQASGEAILARQPKPWRSEPDGVTIRYHEALPLGQLVACLVPFESLADQPLMSLRTIPIGERGEIVVDQPSWLMLRINDAAGEMADNSGGYQVRLE